MTQPADFRAARSKRREQQELSEFEWVDRVILTRQDDPQFIDFTAEGRAYYQRWFTRYGYRVEELNRFDSFVTTVRQILRQRIREAPPLDPNDPLVQQIDAAIRNGDVQALREIAV